MKILQLKRDKDVLLVCKMRRGSGTQGQQPLWSKAAFIARVWIGLDRQAISLTIVHLAFGNSHQRITMLGINRMIITPPHRQRNTHREMPWPSHLAEEMLTKVQLAEERKLAECCLREGRLTEEHVPKVHRKNTNGRSPLQKNT